jgi:hypothetical protein
MAAVIRSPFRCVLICVGHKATPNLLMCALLQQLLQGGVTALYCCHFVRKSRARLAIQTCMLLIIIIQFEGGDFALVRPT